MCLRRQRKPLAALFLGTWLFAFFVGIANACTPAASPVDNRVAQRMAMPGDAGHDEPRAPSANCLQLCADDTPVFSKLQLLQDQPAGQPLWVANLVVTIPRTPADAVSVVHIAHPPPGVPVLLLSLRLAL